MSTTSHNLSKHTAAIFIIQLLFLCQGGMAQNNIVLTNVEAAFTLAKNNTLSLQVADEQYRLAQYELDAAKKEKWNPIGSASATAIDNIQLPVNFLPGEVFGMPEGTFQSVELGQQYVSNINISGQVDVINLAAAEKIKTAQLNEQLAKLNQEISQKSLLENVATTYFNIISIQEQLTILEENLNNNDSILNIIQNRYKEGTARPQDVNQAEVNQLLIQDKISQLEFNVEQQINTLKILCDIDKVQDMEVVFSKKDSLFLLSKVITNSLLSKQTELQKELAIQELHTTKKNLYPSLSVIGNWSLQNNSNKGFFDGNSTSFQSSYLGLRLNYTIPSTSYFKQKQKVESNIKIAKLNANHVRLQEQINNEQLIIDFEKCLAAFDNSTKVVSLKSDTFKKNKKIFESDLIAIDQLLLSLNEQINASLTQKVNEINCHYFLTKIKISQQF